MTRQTSRITLNTLPALSRLLAFVSSLLAHASCTAGTSMALERVWYWNEAGAKIKLLRSGTSFVLTLALPFQNCLRPLQFWLCYFRSSRLKNWRYQLFQYKSLARRNRLEFADSACFPSIQMSSGFRIALIARAFARVSPFWISRRQLDYPVVKWPDFVVFQQLHRQYKLHQNSEDGSASMRCRLSHTVVCPI
jgi:hypothetical protein